MFSSKLKQLQTDWLVHCVPQAVKRSGGKDIYINVHWNLSIVISV